MALSIFLTPACDLRCRYCFNLDRGEKASLPIEDLESVLAEAWTRRHRCVTLTGGEPFLHRGFLDAVERAHRLGYWINVLSHGGLVDTERAGRLQPFWRLRVRISLDGGDAATNDSLRGAGTFARAVRGVEHLLEAGVHTGLGVTISDENLGTLDDVVRLCLDLGVAWVRFIPVARVRGGREAPVSATLHERLLERLVELTLRYREWLELGPPSAHGGRAALASLTTRRCMAGTRFFGVTAAKRVVPCSLLCDHAAFAGERYEGAATFDRVGERVGEVLGHVPREGACGECEFRETCMGGCPGEKLSFDRPLDGDQPVCTRRILEGIGRRVAPADFEAVVGSWSARQQRSREGPEPVACMRQAPYWSLHFRPRRWAGSGREAMPPGRGARSA